MIIKSLIALYPPQTKNPLTLPKLCIAMQKHIKSQTIRYMTSNKIESKNLLEGIKD